MKKSPVPTKQQQPTKAQLKPQISVVPSPELLEAYDRISPKLPRLVMREWSLRNRRAFTYALTMGIIGGLLAAGLIGGFIYLVKTGHSKAAIGLFSAGAVGLVIGFRSARYD